MNGNMLNVSTSLIFAKHIEMEISLSTEDISTSLWRLIMNHVLHPAASLSSVAVVAERLCFHRCLSVHRGGGVHPPGRHPPGRRLLQLTVRILLECILVK